MGSTLHILLLQSFWGGREANHKISHDLAWGNGSRLKIEQGNGLKEHTLMRLGGVEMQSSTSIISGVLGKYDAGHGRRA